MPHQMLNVLIHLSGTLYTPLYLESRADPLHVPAAALLITSLHASSSKELCVTSRRKAAAPLLLQNPCGELSGRLKPSMSYMGASLLE